MKYFVAILPAFMLLLLCGGSIAQQNNLQMNPVVLNVDVECNPAQMQLFVETDGPFTGKVYPKGFFKRPECVQEFIREPTPVNVNLTFEQIQQCGMVMEEGDQQTTFTSVLVVQPHNKLVTMMAKAYQVRCMYDYRGSRLTESGFTGLVNAGLNVSMLGTVWEEDAPGLSLRLLENGIDAVDATAAPPTATMRILLADNSQPADRVNLGDLLEMRIELQSESARQAYGIYVRACTVSDGMGMDSQRLIDENGCTLENMVFPTFSYNEQLTTGISLFKAHKFPYTSEVQYVCYVDFCMKVNGGCQIFSDRISILDAGQCPNADRDARLVPPFATARIQFNQRTRNDNLPSSLDIAQGGPQSNDASNTNQQQDGQQDLDVLILDGATINTSPLGVEALRDQQNPSRQVEQDGFDVPNARQRRNFNSISAAQPLRAKRQAEETAPDSISLRRAIYVVDTQGLIDQPEERVPHALITSNQIESAECRTDSNMMIIAGALAVALLLCLVALVVIVFRTTNRVQKF